MGMFKDKILLVTGGTGSFGRAVVDKFLTTDIKEIRILSRDEQKQDDMRHVYQRKYPDIMMIPQDTSKGYQAVIIEFKYLKAGEKAMLEEKQKEAKEQIQKYAELEEIKKIQNMNKYTIVAVNDELYVEKID